MVVLSAVQHIHLPGRAARRAAMARVRLPVLPEGARAGAERPEAEGAEGLPPGQAGLRGDLYDRGEGLGRRTDIGTDHYRSNIGEYFVGCGHPFSDEGATFDAFP